MYMFGSQDVPSTRSRSFPGHSAVRCGNLDLREHMIAEDGYVTWFFDLERTRANYAERNPP